MISAMVLSTYQQTKLDDGEPSFWSPIFPVVKTFFFFIEMPFIAFYLWFLMIFFPLFI